MREEKEEASMWQPIETAEPVEQCILWCADIRWCDHHDPARGFYRVKEPVGVVLGRIQRYYEDGHLVASGNGMNGDWSFTHWMPLPEAPEPTP